MSKSTLRLVRYEEQRSDADPVRILIVDDVPTNRAVIKSLLAQPAYEFTEASDGEQALRFISDKQFDLVILDVLMPGINGLEVLRIIREDYSETELPVLMLTVKDDIDDVVEALKLGANDYVTRPIDYTILAARINNHISFKRAQDTIRESQAALEQRIAERTYELLQANNALRAEVNERRQAEEKARRSHDRYRTLYDGTPSMFFTLDRAGTVLSTNRYGAEQLGYTVKELVGTRAVELFDCGEQPSIASQIDKCFGKSGAVQRWEGCQRSKDGMPVWVRITARTIDHDDNPDKALLMVCEDITEARNLSKELSHQASHDSLTGLVNRGEFELRLQHVLELARKETSSHALCYMDLDQFKIINDTCGHVAGDELLRQLGNLLQRCVRQQDTVARLGGDEFAVLVTHCNLDQATTVANELQRVLEDFRFAWEGRSFSIAASIGLVPITQTTDSITGLLSAADTACYAAKDEGRNRIHVYHEDDEELVRRYGEMEWISRIDSALEANRFQFYFQEIARVDPEQTDHSRRYELLLRMEDESGNLVRPEAFLPAVERFKHSVKLDRWVIDKAFDWLAGNPTHLRDLSLCSVNLSGHSLGDQGFLNFVLNRFRTSGVPPEKICFEITETATITNLSSATRFIEEIKKMNCRFALDDFGSGLSSFAYLKNLPVDFIKIDGIFVKDIADDPIDYAMVKSINEIAKTMGKQTIAEFVETQAALRKLKEIGVDFAQGNAIGKPKPISMLR